MRAFLLLGLSTIFALGCGSSGDTDPSAGGSSAGGSNAGGSQASAMGGQSGTAGGVNGGGGSSANGGGGAGSGAGGSASGGGGAGGGGVPDPNLDGPYVIKEIDAHTTAAATGDNLPIHCAFPMSGPTSGPYPVVIVAHGFQLPAKQYYGYVKRLASFGYVALTVDFPTSLIGSPNNVDSAKDLLAGVDWAASAAAVAGKADATKVGMTGHSLGGQLALLAATYDSRVKAAITLDPVDGSMNCNATDCPDVSSLMPIAIPTGFLGETIDGSASGCAPATDNYTTFYARTTTPSLEVTVLGANHMSFLDDVASCGFICSFCKPATATNATVNDLAKAYVTAFYERYLRGDTAYDAYLTGAIATSRYVTPGKATIDSR